MEEQTRLFKDIKLTDKHIQFLASFVQNDFKRGLADGHLTQQQLKDSLDGIDVAYDSVYEWLDSLKIRSKALIKSHIK